MRNVSKSDQGVYVCLSATAVSNPKQTRRDHEEEEEKENDNGVQATTSKQSAESATDSHFHENSTITHTEQERAEYEEDNESELERGEDALEFQHTAATDEKPAVWQRIRLSVRTTPGPVSQLYFKPSTILGFLVWRFNRTAASGGYPVRSFTAEYRNVSYPEPPYNSSFEHEWIRMDPINIAPNVVSKRSSPSFLNITLSRVGGKRKARKRSRVENTVVGNYWSMILSISRPLDSLL